MASEKIVTICRARIESKTDESKSKTFFNFSTLFSLKISKRLEPLFQLRKFLFNISATELVIISILDFKYISELKKRKNHEKIVKTLHEHVYSISFI